MIVEVALLLAVGGPGPHERLLLLRRRSHAPPRSRRRVTALRVRVRGGLLARPPARSAAAVLLLIGVLLASAAATAVAALVRLPHRGANGTRRRCSRGHRSGRPLLALVRARTDGGLDLPPLAQGRRLAAKVGPALSLRPLGLSTHADRPARSWAALERDETRVDGRGDSGVPHAHCSCAPPIVPLEYVQLCCLH